MVLVDKTIRKLCTGEVRRDTDSPHFGGVIAVTQLGGQALVESNGGGLGSTWTEISTGSTEVEN